VEINYNNEIVYETLAELYESQTDNAKLGSFLEKALAKYPNNKNIQIIELNYDIKNNKVEESIKKLQEALLKDPNNSSMLFNLAVMFDQTKQFGSAISYYDKATQAKPDYVDAYSNAGALYFNQAVEINKIINNDDKNQIDSFLVKLGKQELFTISEVDVSLKEKNYTNLLSSFANVTDENVFKDKIAKMNEIIKYDLMQGARNVLYNKALPYLEKSFAIDPKNKAIRGALKEIYARMNMLDKANSLNEE
jgi:tetratricopeptide (TPR) repeat protein